MAEAARIRLGSWSELHALAAPIRFAVFVEEQRVPAALEIDAQDPLSLHALAFDAQGDPVATGRLLPDGHIGRMAVLRRARAVGPHDGVAAARVVRQLEALVGVREARAHRERDPDVLAQVRGVHVARDRPVVVVGLERGAAVERAADDVADRRARTADGPARRRAAGEVARDDRRREEQVPGVPRVERDAVEVLVAERAAGEAGQGGKA